MKTTQSEKLFARAQELIPGGVNSPVRSFKSVSGTPRFISSGSGAHITDADGNNYVDYVLSWGPLALGHAHPEVVEAICETASLGTSFGAPTKLENELAEFIIGAIDSIERIRFVSSGTEATMTALRIARAYTGRNKIIKFAGGYHGHSDALLAEAGSGVAQLSLPSGAGVCENSVCDTIVLPYNDLPQIENAFRKFGDEIAAIIVEPIAANMGFVMPQEGFLAGIETSCKQHGALFILDEVMTGFRASLAGAQGLWQLKPDITCLGKVIGGGLPVGAIGGSKKVMATLAPEGVAYQAGTLSGNPLAMAAGLATLKGLFKPEAFLGASDVASKLVNSFVELSRGYNKKIQANSVGTMFGFYFLNEESPKEEFAPICDFASANKYIDKELYARFFHFMLNKGHFFAPSAFEAGFISTLHGDAEICATIAAAKDFFSSQLTC